MPFPLYGTTARRRHDANGRVKWPIGAVELYLGLEIDFMILVVGRRARPPSLPNPRAT